MGKKVALLIAGLVALAITGCGGSDGPSSSNAPSKDEYTVQADQICQQGREDLDAAMKKEAEGGTPDQQEIRRFIRDEVLPNLESQLDELRALTPPEGDEKTVNAIYDTLEKGIVDIKQSSDMTKGSQSMDDSSRMAREYGLKVCGAQN